MPTIYNTSQIEHFKDEAKRLARARQIPHSQALDEIAAAHGFRNWSLLAKRAHAQPDSSSAPLEDFRFSRHDDAWREALRTVREGDARKPHTFPELSNICSRFSTPSSGVRFALEYMKSLLSRPRYFVAVDSQAHAEMRWWLPYVVHEVDDDSDVRLILNRHYKPIGHASDEFVEYGRFSHLHGRFDVNDLRSLSFMSDGSGYLYDESISPWRSRRNALSYVTRLEALDHACTAAAQRSSCQSWKHMQNELYETLKPWARIATWFTGHALDERRLHAAIEPMRRWSSLPNFEDLRVALQQHREENPDLLGGKASARDVEQYARRIVEILKRP